MTFGTPSDSTTATAFADVQHTSDSAFTAADVFTYVTTGAPGCAARSARTSSAVIDSASEQPASRSGKSTIFEGFKSFAVSAMKCTPHITITSASVVAAACASESESPTISATQR